MTRIPIDDDDLRDDESSDDQVLEGVPIGFEFPFYGSHFSAVNISTNGWVSFTSYAPGADNVPLPSANEGVPENLIAPFWDNLFFGSTQRAYARHDGNTLVVSWVGVPSVVSGNGPYTFQLVLYRSGKIRFQYQSMGVGITSATVGIQKNAVSVAARTNAAAATAMWRRR